MAEQTFRSPGYHDTEIDRSVVSADSPAGVPAGVIGTSNKGPAFVPITVASFDDFKSKFGDVDPKKFGPYAAKAFLDNRKALTFLRVLGAGDNETTADINATQLTGHVKNAGFVVKTAANPTSRVPGGVNFLVAKHTLQASEAYGFPMFSNNDAFAGSSVANLVRGMVFLASGTRMIVMGGDESTSAFVSSPPDDYAVVNASGKFKLILSSSDGSAFGTADGYSGLKIMTASMDPSSTDYIGKLLNTDPDKFPTEQHLLYGDFAVDAELAAISAVAVVSGSANTSSTSGDTSVVFRDLFGRFDTRYTTPRTTMFISQPFGTTEYDLFYLEAIDDGEYANTLYKASITDIKVSSDPLDPYPVFTVLVRSWDDNDSQPKVLERYPNVSLNPFASNYIAKAIGDRKVYFNFDATSKDERRHVVSGQYPNRSAYVRVVVTDAVSRGMLPKTAAPFGFRGLHVVKTNDNLVDAGSSSPRRLGMVVTDLNVTSSLSGAIVPPVPYRFKVTKGTVGTSGFAGNPGPTELVNGQFFWGVKFSRNNSPLNPNVSAERNSLLQAYSKFAGIEKLDAVVTGSGADSMNNNKFTLAKVAFSQKAISELTGSPQQHMLEAAYIRNGKPNPTNYAVSDGTLTTRITLGTLIASTASFDFNRFSSYAKFTNMFYGGFDGVNILDKNARRMNDRAASLDFGGGAEASYVSPGLSTNVAGTGASNNAINSYKVASEIMTDPLGVNINVLALPGVREPFITDYASNRARDYGLALYVMDIASYDDNGNRLFDDSANRPSVDKTISAFEGRAIDNNYAATYWPDIQLQDDTNKRRVKAPASVAALAALGFNDRVAYPWFAPAGFNRAALDSVKNVSVKISVPDRERMQDARVNPIVSFPKEGFVIFGQKTLQQARSALDRVNVRRLVLEVKRVVTERALRVPFENPTKETYDLFRNDINTRLGLIQTQAGLESFKVIIDDSNNSDADREAHKINGQIVMVPIRSAENVQIDFIVTNGQVSFG